MILIDCGTCVECRKKKITQWKIRLTEELKHNPNTPYFVTLTINDHYLKELRQDYIDGEIRKNKKKDFNAKTIKKIHKESDDPNNIAKTAVKKFRHRWEVKYKKAIKHWFVTEIGTKKTQRIHLHGIVWQNYEPIIPTKFRWSRAEKENDIISKMWKYGFVFTGHSCNRTTIGYIVKYLTKTDDDNKNFKSKVLTSPGIGKGYLTDFNIELHRSKSHENKRLYTNEQGYKSYLPQYYIMKIWDENERDEHWTVTLNKAEKIFKGIKLSTNKVEDIIRWAKLIETNRYSNYLQKKSWDIERFINNSIYLYTT